VRQYAHVEQHVGLNPPSKHCAPHTNTWSSAVLMAQVGHQLLRPPMSTGVLLRVCCCCHRLRRS
jgi:hypothetical protein